MQAPLASDGRVRLAVGLVALFGLPFHTALAQQPVSPPDQSIGPQRIVSIAPNATEIIYALGEGHRIVGTCRYCVHPPEAASTEKVGGLFDPDTEKIIALRPDLLIVRGKSETLARLCEESDIKLFTDPTEKLADIPANIEALGHLLGREREAARLIAGFSEELTRLRLNVADRPRPRVLITASRKPDELANIMTAGKGSFLDDMVALAGGANLYAETETPYPQVTTEDIVARRPDVIVELMPESVGEPDLEARVKRQWASLSTVPAVASGRIYVLTDANALIPSPRIVEIVARLQRLLHPDLPSSP